MSQTVVDVCNNALQALGAARIISIDDNSREARSCKVAYDSNRRSELRKYLWNFAKTRVVLSADATAPAFEYLYAFSIPSDCLRIIMPNDNTVDWVIEGNKILTNEINSPCGGATSTGAALSLRYIRDIEDTTKWDTNFFEMVTLAMAIDMCDDLTQSNTKKQLLMKHYEDSRAEARASNSFERLPQDATESSWLSGRY